ncbi:hypothetical protein Tco_1357862 [Tanacetum coccineum]
MWSSFWTLPTRIMKLVEHNVAYVPCRINVLVEVEKKKPYNALIQLSCQVDGDVVGPRPSHGDISGNGGARQMLLDNHHVDDDNDEGVDVFDDQKSVGHSITSILQFRFSKPWATWGCVSRDKQDQMSARANGSTGENGSAGVNGPAGVNRSAGVNGSAGENGSTNGSTGVNGSVGSVASTSTGVGESNEVGESSGHQAVEPRWVNDKSRDHMNAESHPHNEELWNKVTPPNRGNTFGAFNASDPVFLLTGTLSTRNASTSHPQIKKVR